MFPDYMFLMTMMRQSGSMLFWYFQVDITVTQISLTLADSFIFQFSPWLIIKNNITKITLMNKFYQNHRPTDYLPTNLCWITRPYSKHVLHFVILENFNYHLFHIILNIQITENNLMRFHRLTSSFDFWNSVFLEKMKYKLSERFIRIQYLQF